MKHFNRLVKVFMLALSLVALALPSSAAATKEITFKAEVWADNWFALYINGKKVGEDSVSIKTERSFNSETLIFKASYPLTIGIVAKDYVENNSGLEYIGKPNQQIGDAGIAIQISEVASKRIVTYSSTTWKVLVIDKAPLNEACVTSRDPLNECEHANIPIPTKWASSAFKDLTWSAASRFTAEQVGVKQGYFDISWTPKMQLIWSADLRLDNTILLRKIIKK